MNPTTYTLEADGRIFCTTVIGDGTISLEIIEPSSPDYDEFLALVQGTQTAPPQ
jgi:hypothetical protein